MKWQAVCKAGTIFTSNAILKLLTNFQLQEWIIPAFKVAHSPGYQMLLMVDNSQGHSVYADDALLVSKMNLGPSGKVLCLHGGWFVWDSNCVTRLMVIPADHPTHPNEPKGIRIVLEECGLWCQNLWLKCANSCDADATSCCATQTLSLCLTLLCRNPESKRWLRKQVTSAFFSQSSIASWTLVKKYLQDNCNYTFNTLKQNITPAMESVKLSTIWKWEHWMVWWLDAYREGMGTKEALMKVKQGRSKQYTSHQSILETAAQCAMDYPL